MEQTSLKVESLATTEFSTFKQVKQAVSPQELVSLHRIQDALGLPKKDILIQVLLSARLVPIYVAKREVSRGKSSQAAVLDELYILLDDARDIFKLDI